MQRRQRHGVVGLGRVLETLPSVLFLCYCDSHEKETFRLQKAKTGVLRAADKMCGGSRVRDDRVCALLLTQFHFHREEWDKVCFVQPTDPTHLSDNFMNDVHLPPEEQEFTGCVLSVDSRFLYCHM